MSTDTAAILDALAGINRRLDAIEARFERAEGHVAELRGVVGMVADTADGLAARQGEANADERLRALGTALEVLTRPDVVRALVTLSETTPTLAAAVPMVEGTIATAGDIFDSLAERMVSRGVDLDERGRMLLLAMERLTAPEAVRLLNTLLDHLGVIRALLDSSVLAPASVEVVSNAAEALVETRRAPAGAAGPFAVLGALSDPDVQRAADFAIRFGRAFGRRLSPQ